MWSRLSCDLIADLNNAYQKDIYKQAMLFHDRVNDKDHAR